MPDYSKLTDQEFDRRLAQIVDRRPSSELLTVPGVYEALSEHFNNQVLEEWERANPILANPPLIYDSWTNEEDGEPGFVDRYSVFPQHGEFFGNKTDFLGCSMGGRAFSQWGEVLPGGLDHLGKRVTLEELDEDTRRHILARITEEH